MHWLYFRLFQKLNRGLGLVSGANFQHTLPQNFFQIKYFINWLSFNIRPSLLFKISNIYAFEYLIRQVPILKTWEFIFNQLLLYIQQWSTVCFLNNKTWLHGIPELYTWIFCFREKYVLAQNSHHWMFSNLLRNYCCSFITLKPPEVNLNFTEALFNR